MRAETKKRSPRKTRGDLDPEGEGGPQGPFRTPAEFENGAPALAGAPGTLRGRGDPRIQSLSRYYNAEGRDDHPEILGALASSYPPQSTE